MNLNIMPFKNTSFGILMKPQASAKANNNSAVFFMNSDAKSRDKDIFVKSTNQDSDYNYEPTTIAGMRERSLLPRKKEDVTPELLDRIKTMSGDEILKLAGIDVQFLITGAKALSCYAQPSDDYTYEDLGVDEEKLLEDVEMVMGETSFRDSSKTNIHPIKEVYGTLYLKNSKIRSLRCLRHAEDIYLPEGSKPKDFGLRSENVSGQIVNTFI